MARYPDEHFIVIVDDDEAVRDSLRAYLTLKGLKVKIFASARQALNEESFQPSLFILDVNMPDVDGFSLLEALRHRGHDAPVVLISGLDDPETRERGKRAGVVAFLDKPIDAPVLYTTVAHLLAKLDF
jgi:two-component system, LuxR family, response regulator FixJ